MSLTAMLAQAAHGDQVTILPGWGQGRATFGGVVAALMAQHMQQVLGEPMRLRTLMLSFIGPVAPGEITLESTVLRRGKSVTQATCTLLQDGAPMAHMLASFGAARSSVLAIHPDPVADFGAPEAGIVLPYIPGVVPEFTQKIDFRINRGHVPFSSQNHGELAGWMRLRHDPELAQQACQLPHLLALVDSWPPSVLQMCSGPVPASTLSWTLDLVGDPATATPCDWWQYHAQAEVCHDGYAHIKARIANHAGQLVAISRQTVTVFA
jgi:acyl-CoA thioesterase